MAQDEPIEQKCKQLFNYQMSIDVNPEIDKKAQTVQMSNDVNPGVD